MPLTTGHITLIDIDDVGGIIVSSVEPAKPTEEDIWLNTAGEPPYKFYTYRDGQWRPTNYESLEELDPEQFTKLLETHTAITNLDNDSKLTRYERSIVRNELATITGVTLSPSDSMPTVAQIDANEVGELYALRQEAREAELDTSSLVFARTATAYNDLRTYLSSLTPKAWDIDSVAVTDVDSSWDAIWNEYRVAYNSLRVAIAVKREQDRKDIQGEVQEVTEEVKRVEKRVAEAEFKVQPDRIISTVRESVQYQEDMDPETIVSRINQDARNLTFDAERVNMRGKLRIEHFNPDLLEEFDGKATKEEAQSYAESAENKAKEYADARKVTSPTEPTDKSVIWIDTSNPANPLWKVWDESQKKWILGPGGPQGVQGPPGANGTSQYVHIRYSANANGSSMTTTPQSTSKYIGLANTTSATAPTSNTAYTWALMRGEDGAQGIPGPPGADGQTPYTWVKYADDDKGTGMSDSPEGKMYIGLAFNKTTPTESNNASDYSWSVMPQNIDIGGRNLITLDSTSMGSAEVDGYKYTLTRNSTANPYVRIPHTLFENNTDYVMTFKVRKISGTVHSMAGHVEGIANTASTVILRDGEVISRGTSWSTGDRNNYPDDTETHKYEIRFKTSSDVSVGTTPYWYIQPNRAAYGEDYELELWDWQLEEGNVATGYRPALEDVQKQLDEKAQTDDLESLAEILTDVSSEVSNKTDMNDFEALQEEFNQRIEQDILDKEQLEADLATLEGRTALVEIIAGESKLVSEFVDMVITQSNEGIFIGNREKNNGMLISDERISFLDNGTEVAYISNQTMEITHGIFVESATIGGFRFEKIPGTETLAITWSG